jgi:hypothetical protein
MHLYTIPALLCPFPTVLHEDKLRIDAHTRRFILNFSIVNGEQFLNYCSQNFATMIARSYPLGDFQDLAAWCDMNTLLFLLDDELDETNNLSKRDLVFFEQQFMEILESGGTPSFIIEHPLLIGLSDIWQRLVARSEYPFQQRIIQGFRDMFYGGWWQYNQISKQQDPSLVEYLAIRQFLGAANLATDSLSLTAQISMPDEIYDLQNVKELTVLARNAICFSNDLFSLSKEVHKSNGAVFNLVTILQRENNTSIQEAIYAAAEMHDDTIRSFIEQEAKLYEFSPEINEGLRKYVEALKHLMIGNVVWSTYETTRYPHLAAEKEDLYLFRKAIA